MPEKKTRRKPGTRDLVHEWAFEAPPEIVWHALTDGPAHAAFTGYPAWIEPFPGGEFRTCGNRNFGRTLAVQKHKRLVQAWSHRSFPEHHWSIADFRLERRPKGRTRLVFVHTGFPEGAYRWLDAGWKSTYWRALDRWIAAQARALPRARTRKRKGP